MYPQIKMTGPKKDSTQICFKILSKVSSFQQKIMKHAKQNGTNQTKNKEQALENMTHTPGTKQATKHFRPLRVARSHL